MPLIKSYMPHSQAVPVYSVFDATDNSLSSFRTYKWRAVELLHGPQPFHKSSKSYRHTFYEYLVWDKNPDAEYPASTFHYTGKKADMLNAFHHVPLSSTDELSPARTLPELQAIANQHDTYLHVPSNPQMLITQFQIIETFLSRAIARLPTTMKFYQSYEVEDLLAAFTRWHLNGIGVQHQQHFDHDLIFLVCRKLNIELAIDNPRPYFNSVQNGRMRGLIKLPWQLPGTVLNHMAAYPTRMRTRPGSGFIQRIHERDQKSMIVPPVSPFLLLSDSIPTP